MKKLKTKNITSDAKIVSMQIAFIARKIKYVPYGCD